MKIDNSAKPTLTPQARSGERTAPTKADTAASADSVTLANTDSGGSFDAGRVAEIKQAIAEGRFTVRPEAIADKLLDSVKELLRD
ncbi:flagellar biosynthesis anti-sigma factor FlgM [Chitinibacteraceae bacterium HSL-7]